MTVGNSGRHERDRRHRHWRRRLSCRHGSSKPNNVQFTLTYHLHADGTAPDATGLYSKFILNFTFDVVDINGTTGQFVESQQFAIGDVTSDAEAYRVDAATGKTLVVLSSLPPGNEVDAGAGDDLIYGAIGADGHHGGAGRDFVSYAYRPRR